MKIELKQAFETLGVPVDASAADVRSAYRSLIRTHHPDHNAGDRLGANDRLAVINAAKDTIDRAPEAIRTRPARPTQETRASHHPDSAPCSDATLRANREAEARAYRKKMEAQAAAKIEAENRAAQRAAQSIAAINCANTAAQRERDEMRRTRQAAFAAALNGAIQDEARPSLLNRLRSLGARQP